MARPLRERVRLRTLPDGGLPARQARLIIRALALDSRGRVAFATQVSYMDRVLTIEADGNLKRIDDTEFANGLLLERKRRRIHP